MNKKEKVYQKKKDETQFEKSGHEKCSGHKIATERLTTLRKQLSEANQERLELRNQVSRC